MSNVEMTSKERIWAAINGQQVDRIPVSPRFWRCAQWKGMSPIEFSKAYGFDYIHFASHETIFHTPFRDPFCEIVTPLLPDVKIEIEKERKGSLIHARRKFHTPGGVLEDYIVQPDNDEVYGTGAVLEWKEPMIKTPEEVELLPYLLPDPKHIRDLFGIARKAEQEIGDDGLFCYRPAHGVDEIVVDAIGTENALIWSLTETDAFKRLIQIVEAWYSQVVKEVLEGGFKVVFDAWFNLSLSVGWSPKFYINTVVPLVRKHAELIHSYDAKLFYYDDGNVKDILPDVVGAGADIIQTITPPPAGDVDFRWLADELGGKACFNGGVDCVKMRFGTADEVKKEVIDLLDIMGSTKRFILGTSDSITEGTPEENLKAFFDTAREYGAEVAKKTWG